MYGRAFLSEEMISIFFPFASAYPNSIKALLTTLCGYNNMKYSEFKTLLKSFAAEAAGLS